MITKTSEDYSTEMTTQSYCSDLLHQKPRTHKNKGRVPGWKRRKMRKMRTACCHQTSADLAAFAFDLEAANHNRGVEQPIQTALVIRWPIVADVLGVLLLLLRSLPSGFMTTTKGCSNCDCTFALQVGKVG